MNYQLHFDGTNKCQPLLSRPYKQHLSLKRKYREFLYALAVTSHELVWLFFEQLISEFVPVLHYLQGCSWAQCWLRQLLVVEPGIAQDSLLKVLATLEPMVVQDVFNRVFELFDDYNCMVERNPPKLSFEFAPVVSVKGNSEIQSWEIFGTALTVVTV